MTAVWHVDDLKVSHVMQEAIDSFIQWVTKKYGSIGEVKSTTGKVHPFVGFKLDFTEPGAVKVDMQDYVQDMIDSYPGQLKGKVTNPSNGSGYRIDKKSPKLEKNKKEQFHTMVAKGLFVAKRGRPDMLPAITFLCSRVSEATKQDWGKLVHPPQFLKRATDAVLALMAESLGDIHLK